MSALSAIAVVVAASGGLLYGETAAVLGGDHTTDVTVLQHRLAKMDRMTLIKLIGRNRWRVTLSTALFLATACGSGGAAATASPASSPSSDSAMMHHAAVDVLNSRYGQVLVDGQGRALYLFAADKSTSSTCYDACATAWPPMLADKGTPVDAMHGATGSLTGTTTRKDGTVQVTYNGHPLYYFEGDKNAGEIKCQAVVNFGAAWYVVDPNGNAITKS